MKEKIKSHAFGNTAEVALSLIDSDLYGKNCLDISAGEGYLSKKLYEKKAIVTAADIYPRQFKFEKVKCDKINLDFKLPYEDNLFDYIFCIETFEHLRNPGICLDEFNRVLKDDGLLILSIPNITSFISRLIFFFTGQYQNFYDSDKSCFYNHEGNRHILPYPKWLIKYILKLANFEIEKIKYSFGGIEFNLNNKRINMILFPATKLFGNTVLFKIKKSFK